MTPPNPRRRSYFTRSGRDGIRNVLLELRPHSPRETRAGHTGLGNNTCTWLRECFRQLEAEVGGNGRNKLHQTVYKYHFLAQQMAAAARRRWPWPSCRRRESRSHHVALSLPPFRSFVHSFVGSPFLSGKNGGSRSILISTDFVLSVLTLSA